jgi:hypothetical protein
MSGLDPGIHLLAKGWIAGSSSAMTMASVTNPDER